MQQFHLEKIIKIHHREAYIWARQCCGFDDELAKDVLQQVYLKILEKRAVFGGKSSVKTWLFSVIRFTAIEWNRKKEPIFPILEDFDIPDTIEFDDNQHPEDLMQFLPTKQKEVLLLVFYHGLTLEKASEVMEIGLGSVRTHYDRAKKNLKELILKQQIHENPQ